MKSKLTIAIVGINHTVATLEELEAVQKSKPFNRLRETLYPKVITEYVAIDTCNRIELYYTTTDPEIAATHVRQLFGNVNTYAYANGDAVEHLFRVSSGLDSMVLGESDIVRQVKQSYSLAAKAEHIGPVLNQLFQRAVHASKVVRSSTGIDTGITSLARYAVLQMEKSVGSLKGQSAVVVGAGAMANKIGSYLSDEGVNAITFVNRTHERAQSLAEKHNAKAVTFDQLEACLATSGIIFTAISIDNYVITRDMLLKVIAVRPDRSLHIMDLGVPRNVDPSVTDIPGIDLYNVYSLRLHIDESKMGRVEAAESAKSYIDHEADEFWDWYKNHEQAQHAQNENHAPTY